MKKLLGNNKLILKWDFTTFDKNGSDRIEEHLTSNNVNTDQIT